MSELRGLGAVNEELVRRGGGRMAAISVDPPELARRVKSTHHLGFSILADVDAKVIKSCRLLHAGGGPRGNDISMPALALVAPDGRIRWRFQSPRVQDRAAVADVMAAVSAPR